MPAKAWATSSWSAASTLTHSAPLSSTIWLASTFLFTNTTSRGGSAVTEHTAVAVKPARCSPCCAVMMHTPTAKWRIPLRNSGAETAGSAASSALPCQSRRWLMSLRMVPSCSGLLRLGAEGVGLGQGVAQQVPAQQVANVVLVLRDVVGSDQDVAHLALHGAVHPDATGGGFFENHVRSVKTLATGELVGGEMADAHVQRHQFTARGVAPGFVGIGQDARRGADDFGVGL